MARAIRYQSLGSSVRLADAATTLNFLDICWGTNVHKFPFLEFSPKRPPPRWIANAISLIALAPALRTELVA